MLKIKQRWKNGDGRNNPDPYASYYVMGDVARKVAPSALYSIRLMDNNASQSASDKDLTGKFSSSTIANQKVASVTGSEKDLPVVYAGGDINAKIEQNYTVVCLNVSLREILCKYFTQRRFHCKKLGRIKTLNDQTKNPFAK